MKKAIYLKYIFLLICTLFAGVVNAQTEDYDYEWVKITNLSQVATGDVVLLIDERNGLALSKFGQYDLRGVELAVSDGKVSVPGNVTASMKWKIEDPSYNSFKLRNNDDYVWGSWTTPSVSVSSTSSDATNVFVFEDYGTAGGMMYYEGGYTGGNAYPINYLCWSQNSQLVSVEESTTVRFSLYKKGEIKEYVKWKMVNGLDVVLSDDDVVVIADQNSAKAMSNDKKDKEPDAVAVNLNDSKDRILGDVAEKVQWTFTNVGGDYHFAVGEKNLYADSEGLKVGSETTNNGFSFSNNGNGSYMGINIDNTLHIAGVDASMFSNVWKLVTEDDDLAKNPQSVIFKKVVDPQKVVKIDMAEYYSDFYTANPNNPNDNNLDLKAKITGADFSDITWSSSDEDVATVANGIVTMKKRGSVVITASVGSTIYHDKASAKCTVVIDDKSSEEPGSMLNPLTVQQANALIESGNVKAGVYYYIKGKVSKVNSGMMAMFGDMDFGEMMGDSGSGMNFEDSMDDMDFDPEDMEESGFDMSSMGFDMSSMGFDMSAMFGTSDKVTYYISDDGTKDNQLKVLNGCGTLKEGGSTAREFNPIPKLSPGDCVIVCGPLVKSKDESMFSSFMGGGDEETWKVGETNHLFDYDPTLLITKPEQEIYVNKTLDGRSNATPPLYTIDDVFEGYPVDLNEDKFPEGVEIKPATYKSSDEDIAKWDEETNLITGVNEGKAKITVKVKVILVKDNPDTNDNEEKSYTMKRKFKLIVKTRDLDPAGYYDGDYVLTTDPQYLLEGTRLILVGTRVKDEKETDYVMVENNAMMGGGKNGSKYEFEEGDNAKEKIPCEDRPKGTLEVILEKDEENHNFWNLNVGKDENDTPLYLYATAKKSDEESNDMMEMFMSSTGLKMGTKADYEKDANDKDYIVNLKASISFNYDTDNNDKNAIIKFIFDGITDDTKKNNTIMLSSSFDMEEMMEMFGGMGGNNNEEEDNPDEPTGDEPTEDDDNNEKSTFDMGSFDMFMASFNTKKPGDEQAKEDEETHKTKAPKCFMPRIYRFVPYNTYDISIGSTEWKTIVSYKDVSVPDNVEAYIVTKVTPKKTQSVATLSPVQIKDGKQVLKGGEPYLLHSTSGNYTLTLLTPNDPDELEAPEGNLLWKSDRKTSGEDATSTVYVLANKSLGVGFYKWIGGDLGAGRVYLTGKAHENPNTTNAHEFVGFFVDETGEATAIESIDDFKANVGPFYDLQGRRVDNPTKGIYIVNGKKVIVK